VQTNGNAYCGNCQRRAATAQQIGNHPRGVGQIPAPRINKQAGGGAQPRVNPNFNPQAHQQQVTALAASTQQTIASKLDTLKTSKVGEAVVAMVEEKRQACLQSPNPLLGLHELGAAADQYVQLIGLATRIQNIMPKLATDLRKKIKDAKPGELAGLVSQLTKVEQKLNQEGPTKAREAEAKVEKLTRPEFEQRIKALAPFYSQAMKDAKANNPQRAQELSRLYNQISSESKGEKFMTALQTLKKLTKEVGKDAEEAQGKVQPSSGLENLPVQERMDLITSLRFGDANTLPQRQEAMAKVYNTIPLDDQFRNVDDVRRETALTNVRNEMKQVRADWLNLAPEKKLEALNRVIEIQCESMGLEKKDWPPLKSFADAPKNLVPPETYAKCNGFYYPEDGKIYLNEKKDFLRADFDEALDHVMHENSHHYQDILIQRLEAGELKPGDAEYQQALLFQLNNGVGYLDLESEAYKTQPQERHSWLAGGEAHKAFVADARAEVQLLVDQMNTWVTNNAGQRQQVNNLCKSLKEALDTGDPSKITKQVRSARQTFNDLVQASKPTGPNAVAQQLLDDMKNWLKAHENDQQWLDEHANQVSSVNGFIRDVGGWLQKKPTGFANKVERYKSIFEGYQ
jgi:hypothetical protein